MKFFQKYYWEEKGTAAIEFALVLPAYLLLVLGIIELGFIMWGYAALEYGASYGARYAFVNPSKTNQQIQDYALSRIAFNTSNFTYTATSVSGASVDVDGTFTYTFIYLPFNPVTIRTHVHQLLPSSS
jgi:Flp pilus assembly protein TadG